MKKNILVVDDDADVCTSIKHIFEHEGHEVWTVKDGVECLRLLEQGFTGILLMDIMMPHMDGWATIRQIVKRGLDKNVDIIVITANGTRRHNRMKGLEPYVLDYIAKPFDIKELIQNIERLN